MARGRQQKWICLDCGAAFAVQGIEPKMCCACGSARLGRAPSLELAEEFIGARPVKNKEDETNGKDS